MGDWFEKVTMGAMVHIAPAVGRQMSPRAQQIDKAATLCYKHNRR